MSLFSRETFEAHIVRLPSVEIVHQWDHASVGKVGGKIFALHSGWTPDGKTALSFKVSDMAFDLLPEIDGMGPAPYLARAKWVQARQGCGLSEAELAAYVDEAHRMVAARLTRKMQVALGLTAFLAEPRRP